MVVRPGSYIHYYYKNRNMGSTAVLYQSKKKLLLDQKLKFQERVAEVSKGNEEAEKAVNYLLKHKSIIQNAYNSIPTSLGKGNIGIDFHDYKTIKSLANAVRDDSKALELFILDVDKFQHQMEEILKDILGLVDDPAQYQALAANVIRRALKHQRVMEQSGGIAEKVFRALAPQMDNDSLLKVPTGKVTKVDTSVKRAIALVEALKLPGSRTALENIANDTSDNAGSLLVRRILSKLGGLIGTSLGTVPEKISAFGLASALNEMNNEMIQQGWFFDSKPTGHLVTRTVDASPEFFADAKVLGLSIKDFTRQGKGDTVLEVSKGKVTFSFAISEKRTTSLDQMGKAKSISIVSNTPFFSVIGRSGAYDIPGFMDALRNAAAGHDDSRANRDWYAGVQSIKYGSFLQHLAGVAKKEGDPHENVLFVAINKSQIYPVGTLINKLRRGEIKLSMSPDLSTPFYRNTYMGLNKWIIGKNTKKLSQTRSDITKQSLNAAWHDQSVRMRLHF